jgi:predicted transcriptional regulator
VRGDLEIENGNRTRIKLLVSVLPGVHLRELQRVLGLSFNTTRYHVEKLANAGEIVRKEEGGFSRLYPPGVGTEERVLFTLVRGETDRKILARLADSPGLSYKQVCELTGLAKSTASEHLARLVGLGVVKTSVHIDRGIVYELRDLARIRGLIRNQDPTLLQTATGRFIDLWDF